MCVKLFYQVVVWRLLHDQLPLSVDLQWALSCLCLALQQPCVWNKLSTPEYTTHTCSLIYCLRLIIVAGNDDDICAITIEHDHIPQLLIDFRLCLISLLMKIFAFAFQWL